MSNLPTRNLPARVIIGVGLTVLATAGCRKPPAEAPAELNELSAFLFQHFEDDDTDELVAGIDNLRAFLDTQDLVGALSGRSYTLTKIEGESLGSLSIPNGASADKQVPVAVAGRSIHADLRTHRSVAMERNQICIDSSTSKYASRTFTVGADCFLDGDCDRAESVTEVRKENLLAKVWYDSYKNYRLLELEDGTEVMIARSWLDQVWPADGGNNSWDQTFAVDVFIPDPSQAGTMQRYNGFWSSISVGGIGDDFYATLVRDGIDESYTFADEFASGAISSCKEDRDRAYDRP